MIAKKKTKYCDGRHRHDRRTDAGQPQPLNVATAGALQDDQRRPPRCQEPQNIPRNTARSPGILAISGASVTWNGEGGGECAAERGSISRLLL